MTNEEILDNQFNEIMESLKENIEFAEDVINEKSNISSQSVRTYLKQLREMVKGYRNIMLVMSNVDKKEVE